MSSDSKPTLFVDAQGRAILMDDIASLEMILSALYELHARPDPRVQVERLKGELAEARTAYGKLFNENCAHMGERDEARVEVQRMDHAVNVHRTIARKLLAALEDAISSMSVESEADETELHRLQDVAAEARAALEQPQAGSEGV